MPNPSNVLDNARRWIGTAENPLGSNRVAGITDWYGLVGPWCAMFISRIFFDAGLPLPATISKGFAYCPSGVNWFKARGKWTGTPGIGYVVFFQWPGSNRAEHVGVVESINADGSINTIEGNTNRSGSPEGLYVMRQVRKSYILGYGIPDFSDTPGPAPAPIPQPPSSNDIYSVEAEVAALPTVQQGSTGQHVRICQGLLVANGRNVGVDGAFGPATAAALREWQGAVGIGSDGVCGPVTWRRLLCI